MTTSRNEKYADLETKLYSALGYATGMNARDDCRCRELSLAITKIEEAIHWTKSAQGLIRPMHNHKDKIDE